MNSLDGEPAGAGYVLWISSHGIPSWANQKAGVDFYDARNLWGKRESNGDYTFNEIFRGFANEVTARYGSDPRLVGIEMRTPFDSAYGEWALGGAERQDGPAEPWAKDWHRVWYEQMVANGGDPSKLIMMASQPILGADNVLADGFGLGMGQRDGLPGPAQVWRGAYGLYVDNGQFKVDESHVNFTKSGTTYSENTEFLFHDGSWGAPRNAYGTFRHALTWNLLVGRNWISYPNSSWADGNEWPLNGLSGKLREEYINHREMIRWSEYQLGKTVSSTDEAFAMMGQRTYEGANWNGGGNVTVNNIGRWLQQKDIAGGQTVPINARTGLHLTYNYNINENADYSARRTDIASGNRNVYFDLDPRIIGSTAKVDVKVSYLDSSSTTFHLEYHDGSKIVSTPGHTTVSAGGNRQSVTFTLPSFAAQNAVDGMDVKLVNSGSADLALDMVRIVKPGC